ncbi:MAG: hypothetical protein ACRDDX_10485 [Cellulosilyticaceae bacterium]
MGRNKHILQLDYDTGEVIEEYRYIEDAAYDNWVSRDVLYKAVNNRGGYMEKRKLRFQLKEECN